MSELDKIVTLFDLFDVFVTIYRVDSFDELRYLGNIELFEPIS